VKDFTRCFFIFSFWNVGELFEKESCQDFGLLTEIMA
jgi:hypothetical protein